MKEQFGPDLDLEIRLNDSEAAQGHVQRGSAMVLVNGSAGAARCRHQKKPHDQPILPSWPGVRKQNLPCLIEPGGSFLRRHHS
jgi:hypothetical protein